jgi:ubiquinone/menaquinone biosynthesis C-methylase UbiE
VRAANYEAIADGYDRRYALHEYAGVRDALVNFVAGGSSSVPAVVEVGCGTGHWVSLLEARLKPSPIEDPRAGNRSVKTSAERPAIAGVEPSAAMIARAQAAAPRALLVRAAAERLPFADAAFDRIYCINALHHFADREQFFAEARRVLRPGGGVLTIGKDPHTERDSWWVYDYFPETLEIDRERFARVRTLRGELAHAGFDWAESSECDRIEAMTPARDALDAGLVHRAYTSQLAVLSDEELQAGIARLRAADAAAGGELQLVTDFYLFATIGWIK